MRRWLREWFPLGSGRPAKARGAGVYFREGLWLIFAQSKTEAGFWISQPPYLAVADDSDDAKIGDALLEALDASRTNVPTPQPDDMSFFKPLLDLAGVGGWRRFSQKAAAIEVVEEKGRVTLTPMRRVGPEGNLSYEELLDRVIDLRDATPQELAASLREAHTRTE